jgi:hypothetical protein
MITHLSWGLVGVLVLSRPTRETCQSVYLTVVGGWPESTFISNYP